MPAFPHRPGRDHPAVDMAGPGLVTAVSRRSGESGARPADGAGADEPGPAAGRPRPGTGIPDPTAPRREAARAGLKVRAVARRSWPTPSRSAVAVAAGRGGGGGVSCSPRRDVSARHHRRRIPAVTAAHPGTRHTTLLTAALGRRLVAAGEVSDDDARTALHAAAAAHIGVEGMTAQEVTSTIDDGLRHGANVPPPAPLRSHPAATASRRQSSEGRTLMDLRSARGYVRPGLPRCRPGRSPTSAAAPCRSQPLLVAVQHEPHGRVRSNEPRWAGPS